MVVEIWKVHSWGYRSITFKKRFNIPSAPFIGLSILEENEEDDHRIEIYDNDYVSSNITYRISDQTYEVNIRHNWGRNGGVSADHIRYEVEKFKDFGWEMISEESQVKEMIDWARKQVY